MSLNLVYLGTRGHVAAIDKATGATLWKTKLKSGLASGDSFVTLLVEEGRVFAHAYGELFCLDAVTGGILWRNELAGMGYGIASLAVEGSSSVHSAAAAAMQKAKVGAATAATSGIS